MKVEEQMVGGIQVVRVLEPVLVGREDAMALSHVLRRRIGVIIEDGKKPNIVLNLNKVEVVGEEVRSALFEIGREASTQRGEIRMVPPKDAEDRELFDTVFRLYGKETSAVTSFFLDGSL